jgi:molybdopterin-guanine dinucleotide biosynthesis protein A
MRVAGAVLCGGRSTRMGADKSLLVHEGEPLVVRVAGALRAAGCRPVVAVGGAAGHLLTTVDDLWPGEGALGGVATALGHFSADDGEAVDAVAVVATDLAALRPEVIMALVAALEAGDHDVAVAFTDQVEPLCAVWRTVLATYLRAAHQAGLRAVHGAFSRLDVVEVAVDPLALLNVNSPADLRRLR